ncbi:protein containing DUF1320, partial [gut metagenome]
MDNFIDIKDYDAAIHREILDSLLKGDAMADPGIIEICEDQAISEMKSYLGHFYDTEEIFSQRGDRRHPLILMMCLDIAIYHIFCIHNPYKMSDIRKDRYDRAVAWMKEVAKGMITIDGAPKRPAADGSDPWQIVSNESRGTY